MVQSRHYSPYSLKVIRRVKQYLATVTTNQTAQSAGTAPLQTSKFYLYYAIHAGTDQQATNLQAWYEADSTRRVIPVPIDSICLHPENYPQPVIDNYFADPQVYYTVVPMSSPITVDVNATIIDTLYVPGETESFLDFTSHLLTGNLDTDFLNQLRTEDSNAYNVIDTMYANGYTLDFDQGLRKAGFFQDIGNFLSDIFHDIVNALWPSWLYKKPQGVISFTDNTSGFGDEPIGNLRVNFIGFTIASAVASDGGFYSCSSGLPPGPVFNFNTFESSKVKVKQFNTSSSAVINTIGSVLKWAFPAQTSPKFLNWFHDLPSYNCNYGHGTQQALWGLIMNGIGQGDWYASTSHYSLRSSTPPKLTVMGYYRKSAAGGLGSTPMMGYIGADAAGLTWMYSFLDGISGPTTGFLDLPDMIITQSSDHAYDTHNMRETIYHEYGHSLHYFKVNDAFWQYNINESIVTPGYGTSVTSAPGNFFALTEGWADYIGMLFAYNHYGTYTYTDNEGPDNYYGNYLDNLEYIRWFNNDFIPRGLFYDLTDDFNPKEANFDKISGFQPKDIYNTFNANMTTIQKFKQTWYSLYPNVNNDTLFHYYNIY